MTRQPDPRLSTDAPRGKLRIVVTHLERLDSRLPTLPHQSPTGKLIFLRAEHPPPSFYRYLYDTVGEQWLWYERRRLADQELAALIHRPEVDIHILYKSGVPAGFSELERLDGGTTRLRYLGLIPEFIGNRLGPQLLAWSLDAAFAGGASRIVVDTCSLDHPKALATYQRAGFVPFGQEIRVIDDPRVTGLMPRDAAPHTPFSQG